MKPEGFITEVKKSISDPKYAECLLELYYQHYDILKSHGQDVSQLPELFYLYLELVKKQLVDPVVFESYHRRYIEPYDYYNFGLDFFRQIVDKKNSSLAGLEQVDCMQEQLNRGENVILMGNHQTESDPQLIDIILERLRPGFVKNMIFVAGARVLLDPLAAPFSTGLNLLCIYSKRHIEHPPEQKAMKNHHNKRTMRTMAKLLKEGGKCIYVAPSGGRDRRNAEGKIEVAPFDARSIDLFEMMVKHAKTPTHFYPLTLATYDIAPPPEGIEKEIGEKRIFGYSPIHVVFGEEINMKMGEASADRALRIYNIIKKEHEKILLQGHRDKEKN